MWGTRHSERGSNNNNQVIIEGKGKEQQQQRNPRGYSWALVVPDQRQGELGPQRPTVHIRHSQSSASSGILLLWENNVKDLVIMFHKVHFKSLFDEVRKVRVILLVFHRKNYAGDVGSLGLQGEGRELD